jgi:hypothetical protein
MYVTSLSRWPYLLGGAESPSTVATPPAPAAKELGVGLRRPCRGQTIGRCATEQSTYYGPYLHRGKVTLVAIRPRRVRVVGRSFAAAFSGRCYAASACGTQPLL